MTVDLFSGVGWAVGLRTLGLHEIGIDLDPAVCATRRVCGFPTVRADVATWPTGHLRGRIGGLIGSPPCQAFSKTGKRLGMRDLPTIYSHVATVFRAGRWVPSPRDGWHDARSPLVLEPLRWVLETRPEWVALEQVEDVLPLWRSFAHVLERHGWSTWAGILCAADYGVAQARYRAILMAHRGRRVSPPAPTHHEHGGPQLGGVDLPRWVSMAEALGWGWEDHPARTVAGPVRPARSTVAGDGTGRVLAGHTNANGPDFDPYARPARTVASDGTKRRLRARTQAHSAVRDLDQPAPTIVPGGRLNDISWVHERPATTVQGDQHIPRPGHRDRAGGEHQQDQAVRVTLAELAVLQGFPPDFPFQGNKTQRAQQIGNALPPRLAAAIVGALTRTAAHVEQGAL